MRCWRRRGGQRVKGCFVLLLWSLKHFTFSHKGHDCTRRAFEASAVCDLCVSTQNTELLWRNSVWVCVMYAACQRSSSYSAGVSPPSGGLCVFSAHLPYFVHLFYFYVSISPQSVQMFYVSLRVCAHELVHERVWVFIGSQWVEQSSWPHFLPLLTGRHSGPRLQRTRHCLEELPVTAAYNHLICHCFDGSVCVCGFFGICQTLIPSFWTTRSGLDCKGETETWEGPPSRCCCHEECRTLLLVREHSRTAFENMLGFMQILCKTCQYINFISFICFPKFLYSWQMLLVA